MDRFLFENSFESGRPPPTEAPPPIETDDIEEELPPSYSEEELHAARQESFANGLSQGLEEGRVAALGAIENQICQTTDALAQSLPTLFQDREDDRKKILAQSRELVLTVLNKLLPTLQQSQALAEVERVVGESLARLPDEPRLCLHLHPDLCPAMTDWIDNLTQQGGFDGKMTVRPDPQKAPGDVHIEWANGGAERTMAQVQNRIFALIDAAFPTNATPEIEVRPEASEIPLDETSDDDGEPQ